MMMTEMDIETLVYNVHLTWLIAREDFIKFTRRESTKTYKVGALHGKHTSELQNIVTNLNTVTTANPKWPQTEYIFFKWKSAKL
jgi:hypothetical protein